MAERRRRSERMRMHDGAGRRRTPGPRTRRFGPDGMWIAGRAAVELAGRVRHAVAGVRSRTTSTARFRAARARVPEAFYAVKAFTAHAMLRMAVDEGLDLLAASGGEVEACLRAGCTRARSPSTGGTSPTTSWQLAVRAGVGLVIADGLDELAGWTCSPRAAGIVQPFLLRVNPGVAGRHPRVDRDRSRVDGVRRARRPRAARRVAAARHLSHSPVPRAPRAHRIPGTRRTGPFLRELDVLVALTARLRERPGSPSRCSTSAVGSASRTRTSAPSIAEIGRRRSSAPADALRRTGPPRADAGGASPGGASSGNTGVTLYRVGRSTDPGRRPDRDRRRRRDVRQHPPDAVRRPVHAWRWPARPGGRDRRDRDDRRPSLRIGGRARRRRRPSGRRRARRPAGVRGDGRVHLLARQHVQPGRPSGGGRGPRGDAVACGCGGRRPSDLDRLEAPAPRAVPPEGHRRRHHAPTGAARRTPSRS